MIILSENNRQSYNRDTSYLDLAEEDIEEAKVQIEQIYTKHKNKANFRILDKITSQEGEQKSMQLITGIAGVGIFFISLIGMVNIYSTLSSHLDMRRKEFAILKSIGISPKGIHKIFFIESVFYSVKPILYSVPILIGLSLFLLNMTRLSWKNIFSILPYGFFMIGGFVLTGTIFSISYLLSKKVRCETIMDVIKDEVQ